MPASETSGTKTAAAVRGIDNDKARAVKNTTPMTTNWKTIDKRIDEISTPIARVYGMAASYSDAARARIRFSGDRAINRSAIRYACGEKSTMFAAA